MSSSPDLRLLAGETPAPPFDFDTFEQRRALARHRRRVAGWGAGAALGVLAIVPVLAVVTRPEPAAQVIAPPASAVRPLADVFQQPPALVDMNRYLVVSELEDYIALLDAQISSARLAPVPPAELHQLESARAQLNDSLQRVSHAHALLDL